MPRKKKEQKPVKAIAPTVEMATIEDLTPHEDNANQGTERGNYMLGASIENAGIGRGIVLDKNLKIIGGNHVHAKAGEMGFSKVALFRTDGDTLVATVREDCDLDAEPGSPEFQRAYDLAIADNRTSQVNTSLSPTVIAGYAEKGVELDAWFQPVELDQIFGNVVQGDWAQGEGSSDSDGESGSTGSEPQKQQPTGMKTPLAIALSSKDWKRWESIKEDLGLRKDSTAFLKVLEILEGLEHEGG